MRRAIPSANRAIWALVAVCVVAFALGEHPSAQAPNARRAVDGEIIVRFRAASTSSEKDDAHRQGRGRIKREIARTGVQLVTVAAGDEDDAITRYRRNPHVLYAERNIVRHIPRPIAAARPGNHTPGTEVIPGDRFFSEQWALDNTGQPFYCFDWIAPDLCFFNGVHDADIDAPEAWALATGAGVTVAVIDTGIDYTHPDLAPNYIGGENFVTPNGNPMDDQGHGTHVAGTIAAALNNLTGNPADEEGVVGVAPNARLLAYKVCDASGNCEDFAIQQAIAQSIAAGARVINMSLGGPEYSQSLNDMIQAAWNAGIVIVAGAGNDGNTNLFYPAAFDHVVSVGAFDEDGKRAEFSNYGSWVDISAPGNVIISSYPMSTCAASGPGSIGCYTWLSGTSMATPHVSGAAALVWSRAEVTTNQQVVDILLNSADPIGVDAVRLDSWTIHGGLNVHSALSLGAEPSDLPVVTVSASIPQAAEAGPIPGAFTIMRSGDTSTPLIVHFVVGGTATPNTDYAALPDTATIDAGASSVTIAVAPIDDTTYESNETVSLAITPDDEYGIGAPASGLLTIVSDDLPADLIVTALTAPAVGGADADIVVSDTTRNQGTAPAPSTATGFYLSTNTTIDAADVLLGSRPVPALAPGAVSTASTTLHVPASPATGSYYVLAKADPDGTVTESVETNNVRTSGAIKIGPDLIVSVLTVPSGAAAGSGFVVTDATKNQGGGTAPTTMTRFFLSIDSILDASDVGLGNRAVPLLIAGVSDQINTTLTLPASTTAGQYFVIAQADTALAVAETTETNNTRVSAALKVGPDLLVSALTVPSTTAIGATITVTDGTKNQGAAPAPVSATAFYLSANTTINAGDTFVGTRPVSALAAGATETVSTTLQIPNGLAAGTYYIVARADANTSVAETLENNNDRASAAIQIGADLAITALGVPATGMAGGSVTVTDTTKNQSVAPASQTSTGFYLSANSTFNPTDTFLGSRLVPALGSMATHSASTSLVVPAATAPGSYYVIAVADWNNAVAESLENNNTRVSSAVRIGPDLTVTSLNAPASAVAGTTINGSDTTMNQGGEGTPASLTRFYLSANTTLDAADTPIGARQVIVLGAGLGSTGSVALTIPAAIAPGTYTIIAKADGDDAIVESSEVNNIRTKTISITAAP